MELDLQLTPRSRILLGILGGVLLILIGHTGRSHFLSLVCESRHKSETRAVVTDSKFGACCRSPQAYRIRDLQRDRAGTC